MFPSAGLDQMKRVVRQREDAALVRRTASAVVAATPQPTTPAASGPSDFQTLAQALTAIYGGSTGTPTQSVPTAVVPVSGGEESSPFPWGMVILLGVVAVAGWLGWRWYQRRNKGGK